jgi:2-oxoglutarate dehydrogenase E1 component
VTWVQEEPENMGVWRFLRVMFGEKLLDRHPLRGIYRPASASPATGSTNSHKQEQTHLLQQVFETDQGAEAAAARPAPEGAGN